MVLVLDLITNACVLCTELSIFWIFVTIFAISEPILCTYRPQGLILQLQVAVLSMSTLLFCIQLVSLVATISDEDDELKHKVLAVNRSSSLKSGEEVRRILNQRVAANNPMRRGCTAIGSYLIDSLRLTLSALDENMEYGVEIIIFIGAWSTIFYRPGISILRCFRVLRLLWFYRFVAVRRFLYSLFGPIIGISVVRRVLQLMEFATKALSAVGSELCRLTETTRGGLLLILLLFYAAFVFGTTLWAETGHHREQCESIGMCLFTMMRLTFLDGEGLDYAYSLVGDHPGLFYLVLIYLCATTFGIANGLVGIFGTSFTYASNEAFYNSDFQDEDFTCDHDQADHVNAEVGVSSFRKNQVHPDDAAGTSAQPMRENDQRNDKKEADMVQGVEQQQSITATATVAAASERLQIQTNKTPTVPRSPEVPQQDGRVFFLPPAGAPSVSRPRTRQRSFIGSFSPQNSKSRLFDDGIASSAAPTASKQRQTGGFLDPSSSLYTSAAAPRGSRASSLRLPRGSSMNTVTTLHAALAASTVQLGHQFDERITVLEDRVVGIELNVEEIMRQQRLMQRKLDSLLAVLAPSQPLQQSESAPERKVQSLVDIGNSLSTITETSDSQCSVSSKLVNGGGMKQQVLKKLNSKGGTSRMLSISKSNDSAEDEMRAPSFVGNSCNSIDDLNDDTPSA